MLSISLDGTGQTRTVDMDALDTSDIDLNPANFRCRADLWYCLDRLYTKIGRPLYREFEDEILKNKGIKLPHSTLGNLIGENSKTSTSRVTWNTVERFVLGCGVPKAELEGWRKAWEASEAQDRPDWPEELERLRDRIEQLTAALAESEARIEQLTADVQKAEARAAEFEKALTGRDQTQSAEPFPSESNLEVLNFKAEARYSIRDYKGAAEIYEQIAEQLKRTRGPGDRYTLQFQSLRLDAEACSTFCLLSRYHTASDLRPMNPLGGKFKERWQELVCEHQRWLPQGDPMTLHLQLRHAYWAAILWSDDLSRRILSDLHIDCKTFLAPNDPFASRVVQIMKGGFWVSSEPDSTIAVAGSDDNSLHLILWTSYRGLIDKINSSGERPG